MKTQTDANFRALAFGLMRRGWTLIEFESDSAIFQDAESKKFCCFKLESGNWVEGSIPSSFRESERGRKLNFLRFLFKKTR